MDSRGPGHSPEKRKVDSSILSLTTTREDFVGPFTCGKGRQSRNAAWHRRRLPVQDPHNAPQLTGDEESYIMAACGESMEYLISNIDRNDGLPSQ